jgi:hypothetical protein
MAKKNRKRAQLREKLWPDADEVTWYRKRETGWVTLPRTLPLISALINKLSKRDDASRVYVELWFRQFDDGFVDIQDEEDNANAAGYTTTGRAVRSWRERIDQLERLGFIRVKPKGTRERGYILLLHPHQVVRRLRDQGKINDWWWSQFEHRATTIGAQLPDVVKKKAFASPFDPDDDLPF